MRHTAAPQLDTLRALVCLAALTAATQPAAADEDCPRVSVVADEQRFYSVAVDYCDGRGPQILTRGHTPRLSPDRTRIVFSGLNAMWIMNVDGTEQRILLDSSLPGQFWSGTGLYPRCWSPDGQQLFFDYGGGFASHVGVVGADGSNPRRLAVGQVAPAAWPSPLSPDGTMLMTGGGGADDGSPVLGIIHIATGASTHLSVRSRTGSWSPDSKWVAFTHDPSSFGHIGLEVVRVDGSERIDVAAAVRASTGAAFEPEGLVTWSADGTELAVEDGSRGQLVAVRVDGASLRAADAHFPVPREPDPTAAPEATWGEVKEGAR